MMISKIRCQKEKINTQIKVSGQGQLLGVILQKLRLYEALTAEVTCQPGVCTDMLRMKPDQAEDCGG